MVVNYSRMLKTLLTMLLLNIVLKNQLKRMINNENDIILFYDLEYMRYDYMDKDVIYCIFNENNYDKY